MADITRWDPFAEMASLRQTMDRLFDETRPWRLFQPNGGDAYFPIDLYETDDRVVLKASLPGVKPEHIDISVTGNLLTLKGESREEREEKGQNYYRRERRQGAFMRQITLPTDVESDRADAVFEHGVLTLTLPKAESVKPRTIKVQAKGMIEGEKS